MAPRRVTVDLLISTYNWPQALETILESVSRQSLLPDQILIADDGSGYKTRLVIEKFRQIFHIPLIHVWQEDNGFRKTLILNKAMKRAKSDYIIQIDGDIVLHKHFIRDHVREAKPKSFVQGSRVMLQSRATQQAIRKKSGFFPFFAPGIKNRFNAVRFPALSCLIKTNPFCYKNIKACNLAFWREDYVAVNGYDNSFQGWGFEDDEFAARLIHLGIIKRRLKFAAVCYHLDHEENLREHEEQNMNMYKETLFRKKTYSTNGMAQV